MRLSLLRNTWTIFQPSDFILRIQVETKEYSVTIVDFEVYSCEALSVGFLALFVFFVSLHVSTFMIKVFVKCN